MFKLFMINRFLLLPSVKFTLFADNMEEAVSYAIKCGARKAHIQHFTTSVTMIDPEGHPFCIDSE